MKKTIIILIGLVVFSVGSIYAQDLKEILDKHFKAIGQEKILKIQSQVTTGKILQMGIEMPIKFMTKRPNKAFMEMEIQGAKVTMGFDGTNGWAIQPWTGSAEPVDLVGADLRPLEEMSDLDGNLWNYQEKGHQLEMLGTEDLAGTEVYVIKNTRKNGNIFYYYLDSKKYVILKMKYKMVVNGMETEMIALMSNFKDVDGYTMPFTTEQKFDGQTGMTINYEEVKFNVEIDDAIFLKPSAAPNEQ